MRDPRLHQHTAGADEGAEVRAGQARSGLRVWPAARPPGEVERATSPGWWPVSDAAATYPALSLALPFSLTLPLVLVFPFSLVLSELSFSFRLPF